MEKEKIMVSVFSNARAKDNPLNFRLIEVLESIKSGNGYLKPILEKIRNTKEHDKQNSIKLSLLPVFCPSGTFSRMEDKCIQSLSGAICIDIDNISDLGTEFARIKNFEFVLSIFKSPSGKGLKALVLHNLSKTELHKELYWKIGGELGLIGRSDLKFDSSCSNLSHPCFWSYDSKLYLNRKATVFTVDEDELRKVTVPSTSSKTSGKTTIISATPTITPITDKVKIKEAILEAHTLFEQYYNMFPGVRNQNLFKLACFFYESGIPENFASDYLLTYYSDSSNSFSANEISKIVESAYKK